MAKSLDLCRILDHFLTSLPHFAVVVFDLNDQVLYHNPVAEELLQCDAGCRFRHDSPSAAQRSLYRLLQGCENHSISSDEIMFLDSEGSQQSLSVNVTPLRGYDGNALGYGLIATDYCVYEQPVRAAFLENVIESLSVPLMVAGADGNVRFLNGAAQQFVGAMSAESRPVELGCPVGDIPGHGRNIWPHMETVLANGGAVSVTHAFGDGVKRQVYDFTFSPLRDRAGKVDGVIKTARDITERTVVEARLGEQEERVQQLLNYDGLTNLPSRLLFKNRLNSAMVIHR